MASYTLSPSIWSGLGTLLTGLARRIEPRPGLEPTAETRRAERELINDIIWSNPDAFSSDLDVYSMLHLYSGRF